MVKTKKKMSKKKNKYLSKKKRMSKKKNLNGGAMAMATEQLKKIGGTDRCDISVDYIKGLEKALYSPDKLIKKLETSEFLAEENKEFKVLFKKNLKLFCGTSTANKYLKFCSNLFNCIKAPRLFYEVMNDIFDLDISSQPKLKTLFKQKQILSPTMTQDDFFKEEKNTRAEAVASFFVKVVFKTFIDFEKRHPPTKKTPADNIFMKDKLLSMFNDIGININVPSEDVETLKEKILSKESAITDNYMARVFKEDDQQNLNENKDKRNPTFIFLVIGGFFLTVILRSNIFSAPPALEGSIS